MPAHLLARVNLLKFGGAAVRAPHTPPTERRRRCRAGDSSTATDAGQWSPAALASALAAAYPSTDWEHVIEVLDQPTLALVGKAGFAKVCMLWAALRPTANFPVRALLRRPWSNSRAQLAFLCHAIWQVRAGFSSAGSRCQCGHRRCAKPGGVGSLRPPPARAQAPSVIQFADAPPLLPALSLPPAADAAVENTRQNNAWRCPQLSGTLLHVCSTLQGAEQEVRRVLDKVAPHAPEDLLQGFCCAALPAGSSGGGAEGDALHPVVRALITKLGPPLVLKPRDKAAASTVLHTVAGRNVPALRSMLQCTYEADPASVATILNIVQARALLCRPAPAWLPLLKPCFNIAPPPPHTHHSTHAGRAAWRDCESLRPP